MLNAGFPLPLPSTISREYEGPILPKGQKPPPPPSPCTSWGLIGGAYSGDINFTIYLNERKCKSSNREHTAVQYLMSEEMTFQYFVSFQYLGYAPLQMWLPHVPALKDVPWCPWMRDPHVACGIQKLFISSVTWLAIPLSFPKVRSDSMPNFRNTP